VQAVAWLRKAAEQGHDGATNWLAEMYEKGRGVPRDLAQAKALYRKAADRGDYAAKRNLARLEAMSNQ
jgi:TPR repeat protein